MDKGREGVRDVIFTICTNPAISFVLICSLFAAGGLCPWEGTPPYGIRTDLQFRGGVLRAHNSDMIIVFRRRQIRTDL